MPALAAGIHAFLFARVAMPQSVNGRDRPGNDGAKTCFNVTGIQLQAGNWRLFEAAMTLDPAAI
jgi:hypothetical protein